MKNFAVLAIRFHTASHLLFIREFAGQFGIELSYERILSPLDGFRDSVSAFLLQAGWGECHTAFKRAGTCAGG